MDPANLEEIAARYRRLSDYDIAEFHAQGPAAFSSPSVWQLLENEYQRRTLEGPRVQGIETELVTEQALTSAVSTARAPVHVRALQGIADLSISLLVLAALATGLAVVGLLVWPLSALILVAAPVLYPGLFEARTGATPVMRLFRLRVADHAGRPPSLKQIVFRAVLKTGFFVGLPLGLAVTALAYFAGASNPWFHDYLTKTTVVRVGGKQDSAAA